MTQTTGTKRVFDMRFEARYGETMSNTDIEAAREVVAEMQKFATAAEHMRLHVIRILHSDCPNHEHAARYILSFRSTLHKAEWEIDSLHECYVAQFTEFDDDGEIIDIMPDFNYSEQSILEYRAVLYFLEAEKSISRASDTFNNLTNNAA